jgi:hypothetical protein
VLTSIAKCSLGAELFVGSYPVPSITSPVTFVIFKSSQQTRWLRQASPVLPYAASLMKSEKTIGKD